MFIIFAISKSHVKKISGCFLDLIIASPNNIHINKSSDLNNIE